MKSEYLRAGEGLLLYRPHPEQAEALYALIDQQRPYLGQWLSWVESTRSQEDIRRFLSDSYKMNIGGQQLTTIIQHEGVFCGSVGYVKINNTDHHAEIGYWLSESHQGQGIMTKACRRLIRYGFEKMGLHRIVIRVAVDNASSLAVPLRLGFVEEGIQREAGFMNGKYYSLRVFSLLVHEWEDMNS